MRNPNTPPVHPEARAAYKALGAAAAAGNEAEVERRRKELSRRGRKGGEATARKKDIANELNKLAQEKKAREDAEAAEARNEHVIPTDPLNPETPESYR